MYRRVLVAGVLLLAASATALSQSFYAVRRQRSLIFTAGAGSANYFGELVNPRSLGIIRPGLNIGLEHGLSPVFAARVETTWFQISGDDAKADDNRTIRNLSFVSNNIEFATTVTASLFRMSQKYYQRPAFNIYLFTGFGLTFINPKTNYNGEKVALQPLMTEGIKYSRFQPVIPIGGGIKLKMGPMFNLNFEAGIRKTFTDYLDDVSVRLYPDPSTLSSDLARALSNRSGGKAGIRGNPESNDWYFMMNARLQYYLPVDFVQSRSRAYAKRKKTFNNRRRR